MIPNVLKRYNDDERTLLFMESSKRSVISVGILSVGLFLVLVIAGCGQSSAPTSLQGKTMTVYYSPSCTCCGRYIEYLQEKGLSVNAIKTFDRTSLMRKHGISRRARSCHTGIIGEYFVEGHVPVESLDRLLREKPDLAGITIPGMPQHAPGMGGRIGQSLRVISVDHNGRIDGVFDRVEW